MLCLLPCRFRSASLWRRQRRARRAQKMHCGCRRNMNHHFDSHSLDRHFPVGAPMAIACTVWERGARCGAERRQPASRCGSLLIWLRVGEKWVCRSRNGDSRTWINSAALWENYWLFGFWATAAHSSLLTVLLTGRHFLLKVAQTEKPDPHAFPRSISAEFELESILYSSPIHPTSSRSSHYNYFGFVG